MFRTWHESAFFIGFLALIGLMLAFDLGLFNRKSHELKFREALGWTLFWITLSLAFFGFLRYFGHQLHDLQSIDQIQANIKDFRHPIAIPAGMDLESAKDLYNRNLSMEYLAGYLIEYSLSVDNIFVIIMIFLSFAIRKTYYHRILFWGILGAIVMRFLFIFTASALIRRFDWILYIFGILLIYVGFHMAWEFYQETYRKKQRKTRDPHDHWLVKWLSKVFLVTSEDKGDKFWVWEKGKFYITPLFIVLVLIEFSDLVFAVDSVPAVFSVTRDPFIVFFSNIFAILGLRSLFFLVMNFFGLKFLRAGLAILLTFVGAKMCFEWLFHIPTNTSLLIILGILVVSVLLSLFFPGKKARPEVNIQ